MRFLVLFVAFMSMNCISEDIYKRRVKHIDFYSLESFSIDVSMVSDIHSILHVSVDEDFICDFDDWGSYSKVGKGSLVKPYDVFNKGDEFIIILERDYDRKIFLDLSCLPRQGVDIYSINVLPKSWKKVPGVDSWTPSKGKKG